MERREPADVVQARHRIAVDDDHPGRPVAVHEPRRVRPERPVDLDVVDLEARHGGIRVRPWVELRRVTRRRSLAVQDLEGPGDPAVVRAEHLADLPVAVCPSQPPGPVQREGRRRLRAVGRAEHDRVSVDGRDGEVGIEVRRSAPVLTGQRAIVDDPAEVPAAREVEDHEERQDPHERSERPAPTRTPFLVRCSHRTTGSSCSGVRAELSPRPGPLRDLLARWTPPVSRG